MTNLPEQIRSLLVADQTEAAIDALMNWAKTNYEGVYDQCILLRSRWEKIEQEANLGMISREEAMRQTTQVNAGLLAMVSDIEHGHPSADRSAVKRNPWPIIALVAGVLILGGFALGWFKWPFGGAEKKEASSGSAVRFPDGKSLTLVENNEEVTYEVLEARVERLSSSQNRLNLRLLCSPMLSPRRAINFWSASFRFLPEGGTALAPSNDLNLLAESHASTEGDVQFVLPASVTGGQLQIKYIGKEDKLGLSW